MQTIFEFEENFSYVLFFQYSHYYNAAECISCCVGGKCTMTVCVHGRILQYITETGHY